MNLSPGEPTSRRIRKVKREARVSHTMSQFKKYIERRGMEQGGWRGEVHGGEQSAGAGGASAADSRIGMSGSQSGDAGSAGSGSPATPGGGRSSS